MEIPKKKANIEIYRGTSKMAAEFNINQEFLENCFLEIL